MTNITIQDFMPMVADVVSGAVPRPTELQDGETPTGQWYDTAPAWRGLSLDADCKAVAGYGTPPTDNADLIADLRAALGEPGAAVVAGSRVIVFNRDGTRAAFC
jgi:hypothetical protein